MSARLAPHPVEIAPPGIARWAAGPGGVPFVQERTAGRPGPEVLLTALVHGNEYAGAIALDAFLASGLVPRAGRITAAFCNVAAFAAFDAAQPDASRFVDEDFNRVWHPALLAGPSQSTELHRARQLLPLLERATHLLDLHSMHEPGAPLLVTGLLPRNIAFAQRLASTAQAVADAGHADGVRMRDWGPFGAEDGTRIALLLEAGQHWDSRSVDVSRDVLMRFLLAAGSLRRSDVPTGWLLPEQPAAAPLLVTHRVVARSMDFRFTADFHGGEVLAHAGSVIAHDAGLPVVTPYDGCVLVMPSVRQLRPGVTTVRLARPMDATQP